MLENKKDKKLRELLEITNISDEELEKLNFKEKQRYFKAKNKLCKVFFVSKNESGKGLTYKKPKVKKDGSNKKTENRTI